MEILDEIVMSGISMTPIKLGRMRRFVDNQIEAMQEAIARVSEEVEGDDSEYYKTKYWVCQGRLNAFYELKINYLLSSEERAEMWEAKIEMGLG